ncbi:MAG: response regulator [Thermodesulfobacteriota bacterium]|nr:response regulator [Thermodesulfobacteriota bacterium]
MSSILVIDDDSAFLNMLKIALERFGHYVETAANGEEGVRKFYDGLFDLVITDIRMCGMDGNAVAHQISNSPYPSTPIVGISGTPQLLENRVFNTVISKPFSIKVLIDCVSNLSMGK